MAIFTAATAALVASAKALTLKAFFIAAGKFILTTLVTVGISRILAKRSARGGNAGGDGGARIQLPPATDNKIPVVYGSAFMSGPITDAKITYDQKTMYYVIALAEVCDTTPGSAYTFGNIYYDGKLVGFDGIEPSKVMTLTTNTTPAQVDTKIQGYLYIYLFPNGSADGVTPLPGSNTALTGPDILSDINIPNPWTNSNLMTNCAYAIVKIIYNVDASTTGLGAVTFQLQNNLDKPGSVIKDYLLNTRYGCAIPLDRIDTTSLTALDAYSDELITYIPANGDTTPPLPTQARYRVNGPIDTAGNCLENLQVLVDSCDSWLQYSELTAKWRVIMNKSFEPEQSIGDLFAVNSSNLVGGMQINPIGLNETYNEVEVAYPNANIKDQNDYQVVLLSDYQSNVMSPNEAINRLNFNLPVINNAVQAKYLAVRRLLQSREDLVVQFQTDFSGIVMEAGDVIKITFPPYGWTDKLFRVSSVAEEKYSDGNLGAQVVAFEYNETIYDDQAIVDYIPAFNTGLTDPNVFSLPDAPTIALNSDTSGNVTSMRVTGNVPTTGTTIYMDFNYGSSNTIAAHRLYRQVQNGLGVPFTANAAVNVDINDIPAGNYYFSITARNNTAGRQGPSSNLFDWSGADITTYDANTGFGGIGGTQIQPNSISGNNIIINTITGNNIAANTITGTNITGNTITGFNIQISTITGNKIADSAITGNLIAGNTIGGINIQSSTITGNKIADSAITGNLIANNTITGNLIAGNTIAGFNIIGNTITGNLIQANTITGSLIAASTITGNLVAANTIAGFNIVGNTITGNLIAGNTIVGNNLVAGTITGNLIAAFTIVGNNIAGNTITGNNIVGNTITGNLIQANAITADLISANAVTANKISVGDLSAISANMGTLTSGNILTDAAPNFRTEISSTGSFPIWFGNGTKTAANGLFYVQTDGNVFIKAIIDALPGSNIPAPAVMTVSIASISGNNSGFAPTGNVTSSAAVVTITNGTSPYTYSWTKQLDALGTTTISSNTSSGPTFSATDVPDATAYTSIWNCQVTDTNSNVANGTAYVRLLWIDIT
jgi:hypothetical protein